MIECDVSDGWRRSIEVHRVDPESPEPTRILTDAELRRCVEPIERVALAAQTELEQVHKIAGPVGYVTLLCDCNGVAIDYRGNDARAAEFLNRGTWRGGVWAESAEGTNAIGTCIVERRPLAVHQKQHFRARHAELSCAGAPVFGPDAALAAVLDVSSIDPELSAQAHALTLPLVTHSARLIEERLFREMFCREWIVAVAAHGEHPTSLLAVNRHQEIVGADRYARAQFHIDAKALENGLTIHSIFASSGLRLPRSGGADAPAALTTVHGGSLFVLISSPRVSARIHIRKVELTLAAQPRTPLLADLQRRYSVEAAPRGLSPRMVRRVVAHIDAHFAEELTIETLAAQAGLSAAHFARAFKVTLGMPPHRYLLQERITRAAALLRQTDEPVTAVALAVGFADQSHFSRSFHRLAGLTPSQFRRAHR